MWQHHKGGQDLLCSAIERREAERTGVSATRKDFTEEGCCLERGHSHRGQACGNPYLHMFSGDTDARNPQETDKNSHLELRAYERRGYYYWVVKVGPFGMRAELRTVK